MPEIDVKELNWGIDRWLWFAWELDPGNLEELPVLLPIEPLSYSVDNENAKFYGVSLFNKEVWQDILY